MPNMFRGADNCEFFCILAATMGTVAHPWALEGGIAHANKLYLKAGEVHVVIPSGAAWSSLCITCEELDIRQVSKTPRSGTGLCKVLHGSRASPNVMKSTVMQQILYSQADIELHALAAHVGRLCPLP